MKNKNYFEIRKDYYKFHQILFEGSDNFYEKNLFRAYDFRRKFSVMGWKNRFVLVNKKDDKEIICIPMITDETKKIWRAVIRKYSIDGSLKVLFSVEERKTCYSNSFHNNYENSNIWIDLLFEYNHGGITYLSDGTHDLNTIPLLIKNAINILEQETFYKKLLAKEICTPLVLSPTVSAVLFHELIGHGLEEKDLSGSTIGPQDLNVYAYLPNRIYDDEGSQCYTLQLIKDGVVIAYPIDRKKNIARSSGLAQSGTADGVPRVRLTHLLVAGGATAEEAILSSVKRGIFCNGMESAQYCHGTAFIKVNRATLIKDGNLIESCSSFSFTISLKNFSKKLVGIAKDTIKGRSGRCVKYFNALPTETYAPLVILDNMRIFV